LIKNELEQLDLKNTIACNSYVCLFKGMSTNFCIIYRKNCKKCVSFVIGGVLNSIGIFWRVEIQRWHKWMDTFWKEDCCNEIRHIKLSITMFLVLLCIMINYLLFPNLFPSSSIGIGFDYLNLRVDSHKRGTTKLVSILN